MRFALIGAGFLCVCVAASAGTPQKHKKSPATTAHRKPLHTAGKRASSRTKSSAHKKAATAKPAPARMDPERATQIQSALIKNGYLSGEASGTWDSQSITAMQKLQADNGWQTKVVPDSRALIKLGLGPQQPH